MLKNVRYLEAPTFSEPIHCAPLQPLPIRPVSNHVGSESWVEPVSSVTLTLQKYRVEARRAAPAY